MHDLARLGFFLRFCDPPSRDRLDRVRIVNPQPDFERIDRKFPLPVLGQYPGQGRKRQPQADRRIAGHQIQMFALERPQAGRSSRRR